MFCSVVAGDVLLGPTSIEALLSSGGELVAEYRCSCGERGVWRAGRGEPHLAAHAS